jgi:methionyl aminopeptidase
MTGGLFGAISAPWKRMRGRMIELKSPGELEAMRASGLLVAQTLKLLTEHVRAGVSTEELDELAEQNIRDAGAVPSFKGYHGFPATICSSVNEQVVHGIPGTGQVLAEGDLISVDCGAVLDGWHGDSAVTVPVGAVTQINLELSKATRDALYAGIAAAVVGARLGDISHAIETDIAVSGGRHGRRYGVVADYGGHGIGTEMHMDPFVPNRGEPGRGPHLRAGMALAIEPMLTLGTDETRELDDEWTVVTADNTWAAHWEHSIAVTDDGPWILTELD